MHNKGPYHRRSHPIEEERATVKRYWQYGPRKQCGHARIMLNCRHCIDAARIEMQWNRQQRSAP